MKKRIQTRRSTKFISIRTSRLSIKNSLCEQAEAEAASQLAAAAGDRFKVGPKMRVEKGVPSTMESSVVQALVASVPPPSFFPPAFACTAGHSWR